MSGEYGANLIQTMPLHGRRLIEASAGTGKTYTLAGLYLRLVLGVGCEPRLPPDILVLTFTRAATRELRDRIRGRLVEASKAFRVGSSSDDNLQWLIGQFPCERHTACARLLDVAAGWMDEAAIHTIHAWCQTMLRQHAFDSGSLFEAEVDAADPVLYRNAVADYWRDHIVIEHPLAAELAEKLNSPAHLGQQLSPLLRPGLKLEAAGQGLDGGLPPDQALAAPAAWHAFIDQTLEPLRRVWLTESDAIRAVLVGAVERGELNANKITIDKAEMWFEAVDGWARSGGSPPEFLFAKLRASYIATMPKKNQPLPQHAWFDQVEAAARQVEAKGPVPDWVAPVLAHAVAEVGRRQQAEKQRLNRLDFEDLLIHLDRALTGPGSERLRATILRQYPIALVDEFQDTDPVQYRIFEQLWGRCADQDTDHGLFLIGDPKQSIYSFRGADIHAYMRAREHTISQHSLGRNFRSVEGMVEAVNHLFAAGESHPRGAFAFSAPGQERRMPFETVQANGRGEALLVDGEAVVPMTLGYMRQPAGRSNVSMGAYVDEMAVRVAEEVARLLMLSRQGRACFRDRQKLQTSPVQAADMAVLVRTGKQAEKVRRALAQRGVKSVYLSDRASVFDEDQARELSLVLAAIADPGSERKLRSALATRLFGWSLQSLDALNRDEQQLEGLFDRFAALRDLWERQGVLVMIHALLADFDLPRSLLSDPIDGERAMTNVLHLAELLQTQSQSIEGEHALLKWLNEQVASEWRGQSDSELLRLESDAGLVKVVTIHAAKGLEYPMVFVPFPCHYKGAGYISQWTFHGPQGQRVVDLAPSDEVKQQVLLENLQEDLRLFYVAVTRARHACWIGLAPVASGSGRTEKMGPQLERFAPGHLLLGLASDQEHNSDMRLLIERLADGAERLIHVEAFDGPPGYTRLPDEPTAAPGPARVHQRPSRENWWIASYSALKKAGGPARVHEPQDAAEDQALEEADGLDDKQVESGRVGQALARSRDLHGFPRGPRPGTFLHSLLEWAGAQGLAETSNEPQAFLDQIERRCRLRGWENWTKVVQRWMLAQLRQPMRLGEHALCLADLPRSHYTPELEFWFQASRVDTDDLDRLVRGQTFGGAARVPLAPNELNGMMRGFIDLVFEHKDRYYVLDYKSNHLGDKAEDYDYDAMRASVLDKRYDLQFAVYTLALHRLLKSRLSGYDFDRHVGGAVYLYLRGCESPSGGVFHYRPDRDLIEALDRMFAGQEVDHAT